MDVRGRGRDGFVPGGQRADRGPKVELPRVWIAWGGASRTSSVRWPARVIVPLTSGSFFILLYTRSLATYATLIIANVPFAIIGDWWAVRDGQYFRFLGDRLYRRFRVAS